MFRTQIPHTKQLFSTRIRKIYTRSSVHLKDKLKIDTIPPPDTDKDWIGPPDPDSNLRPIKFHVSEDETSNQKLYRTIREDNHTWNEEFWVKHNKEFYQQKEEFIQTKLQELGPKNKDGTDRRLTPEELAVFYKRFLDDKYSAHIEYNREWYKRNIFSLWPALKVQFDKIVGRTR